MTRQVSSLLSSSLLFTAVFMKIYTRRALFSGFIQNSSNEDKLLPGWATMAPPTLKRTKMAEWKWAGQRRSALSINSHITTHTHVCAQMSIAHWGVIDGDSRHLSHHSSPRISSFEPLCVCLSPSLSSLNIIIWIASRWWDVGPGIKLRKRIRESGITDR